MNSPESTSTEEAGKSARFRHLSRISISISPSARLDGGEGGFEALNVEPCTGLHGLVKTQETRQLSEFQFSLDLTLVFWGVIRTENVAQQHKM